MLAGREPADLSGKRHWRRPPGMVRARVSMTAHAEPIVNMADRTRLRNIFDQVVPLVLLAVAGAGFVYAIAIAATLRDLRALEPLAHPDLETWRCAAAAASPATGQGADGQPRPSASAPQQPTERSASCPPHAGQARPQ